MKFKLILRKNPQNQAESKYYASPINEGIVSLDDIAEQISGRSTVTYGDILGVLQNFIEFIPFLLMMGKSVSFGKLGAMRVSFSSEGVDTPEKFTSNLITTKKIIFSVGKKLKDAIGNMKPEIVK